MISYVVGTRKDQRQQGAGSLEYCMTSQCRIACKKVLKNDFFQIPSISRKRDQLQSTEYFVVV